MFDQHLKVMGYSQAYDFSAAFRFDVGGWNVPFGVYEVRIDGTRTGPE
jgi:hypothetical protein